MSAGGQCEGLDAQRNGWVAMVSSSEKRLRDLYLYNLSLEELVLGTLDTGVRGALEAHEPYHPQRRFLHADHLFDRLSRHVGGPPGPSRKGRARRQVQHLTTKRDGFPVLLV